MYNRWVLDIILRSGFYHKSLRYRSHNFAVSPANTCLPTRPRTAFSTGLGLDPHLFHTVNTVNISFLWFLKKTKTKKMIPTAHNEILIKRFRILSFEAVNSLALIKFHKN